MNYLNELLELTKTAILIFSNALTLVMQAGFIVFTVVLLASFVMDFIRNIMGKKI